MIALLPVAVALALAEAPPPAPVYQAVMMRAAPGHLVDLIRTLQERLPVYQQAGEPRPILLRHAQGDQWDVMLLAPIGSMADRFSRTRENRWRDAVRRARYDEAKFSRDFDRYLAWAEELYVTGPPVSELQAAVARSGYFHLEIFQALAGKRDSLLAERNMENEFLARIGRPTNFLFTKVTGAAWDAFTIGFYRDLQHYAEPSGKSAAEEDAAAKAAGFESRGDIGPYLRRFLQGHHDTLGSIVK